MELGLARGRAGDRFILLMRVHDDVSVGLSPARRLLDFRLFRACPPRGGSSADDTAKNDSRIKSYHQSVRNYFEPRASSSLPRLNA